MATSATPCAAAQSGARALTGRRARGRARRAWPLALLAMAAGAACAQTATTPQTVVITGTTRALALEDAPFAASVVTAEELRQAGPMVNLSEALVRVPGLVVNNRQNYAQDLQMSSRGFGARATFGVRGLRLYTDGIPATMPDGQGQVSHFDLASAERIEVLRGPFSVLYGNSSGGVVALFTEPVRQREASLAVDAGSFGLRQLRASVAAPLGQGFDLRASVSRFDVDGVRAQSAADRELANLRLGWRGASDRVTVIVSSQTQNALDPLGLTPADFAADPRQTTQRAFDYNTRKTVKQTQIGASWRHGFEGDGVLRALETSAYTGQRAVVGYLSIPSFAQAAPTQGGGVVDFDRDYRGVDARLEWRVGPGDLTTGITWEFQSDDRFGYLNFTGTPQAPTALGVLGALKRSEVNEATTREAYAQLYWPLRADLALTGGVRSGEARLSTVDRFLANGDDSGDLRFSYTNPVLGLSWKVAPQWTLHASAARGFESPTLGELAYAPAGQVEAGFNRSLAGQSSRQVELGAKWRGAAAWADAAVFHASTRNEIGVLASAGGRTTYQNVGDTRRRGAELGAGWQASPNLRLATALTWLDATYRDAFNGVTPGNRIAGTARATAWAEAAWRPGLVPGELALEWRANSAVAANDVNTEAAPGYALWNLRWTHALPLGPADQLQLLARVDNLTDRVHVGSVIVNEGNNRFFEPGLPRNLLLSVRWVHAW